MKKTPRKQESSDLSFFKREMSLEYVFMLLPGIVHKSEFASVVIINNVSMKKIMFLPHVACPCLIEHLRDSS